MLISVIIPTRNRPDFLPLAVASVLTQSYKNLELIIVNDGATAVPLFPDVRVRIIDSGQCGAVPARNLGVTSAQGEAIAWLDDDDVWTDTHFLKHCADNLLRGGDFIFADGMLVFPDGRRKPFSKNASSTSLEKDNTILISAVCYRKALHDQLGAFDGALPYYWDWDWYLRVARRNFRMTRFATPVVDIRIHAQNMSGLSNEGARRANLLQLCNKHGLPEIELKSHIDFV
jgi:glycosyltransferase involved in cell wall biosynthesis